jgi:hypothetical protein
MNSLFLAVVLAILVSCSGNQKLPPQLVLMNSLAGDMRDAGPIKSECLVELTKVLALQGYYNDAEETAQSIPNYRSAMAKLCSVEARIEKGEFQLAAEQLLSTPYLPKDGVAQQQWEIISKQLSLAEAVEVFPEMVAAYVKAKVPVPPLFRVGDATTVSNPAGQNISKSQTLGSRVPSIDSPKKPLLADNKKSKGDQAKDSGNQPKNYEASEGGEKLMARMKAKMGFKALMVRAEGLLALQKRDEAKQLMLTMLTVDNPNRFPNLLIQTEYYGLAWQAGLEDQVRPFILPTLESLKSFPVLHSDLGAFLAAGIVLACLDGKQEMAQVLLAYGKEGLRQHSEFSRNENYAKLGEGCWRAGLEKEARDCWERSLQGASVIPNPQSRAVGAFQVLLAQIHSQAPTLPNEEKQIRAILEKLPEAYSAIGQ